MTGFDLLLLAFKGVAIASVPVAAIWVGRGSKSRGDRLRRLAWVTAFLTFDLIVFGGFTRLTDSGLGCPDWPGCYAKANPSRAADDIRAAEAAMPYGPVSMNKAWIEMIHRYLAMAVGLLIVAMLVVSVRRRVRPAVRSRPSFPGLVIALLALVAVQGAFGAWTVTEKLQPIFVTTHLLLGMTLLAMLSWHALRFEAPGRDDPDRRPGVRRALHALGTLAIAVLVLQIALGGWVSANYAVLACTDFPKCQGVWLPAMDFASGFHPWRQLGRDADGGALSIAALTAIHWTHRGLALVVFVVVGAFAWRARGVEGARRPVLLLVGLLLGQIVTGLVNVVYAWPLVAAVLHNAGAAGLLATLVVINYRLPRSADPSAVPSRGPLPGPSSLPEFGRSAR